MHFSVVVVLALVAAATAMPQVYDHQEVHDDFGQYSYSYRDANGAAHSDHGELKSGPEGLVLVRSGSHAYTSPEGVPVQLSYTADENGYHPSGRHLPVAPAAPVV